MIAVFAALLSYSAFAMPTTPAFTYDETSGACTAQVGTRGFNTEFPSVCASWSHG